MYIFGAHTQYLIFNELKKEIIFKFLNLFCVLIKFNFKITQIIYNLFA